MLCQNAKGYLGSISSKTINNQILLSFQFSYSRFKLRKRNQNRILYNSQGLIFRWISHIKMLGIVDMLQSDKFNDGRLDKVVFIQLVYIEAVMPLDILIADSQKSLSHLQRTPLISHQKQVIGRSDEVGNKIGNWARLGKPIRPSDYACINQLYTCVRLLSSIKYLCYWPQFIELLERQGNTGSLQGGIVVAWPNLVSLGVEEEVSGGLLHICCQLSNKFLLLFHLQSIIFLHLLAKGAEISRTYRLPTSRPASMSWINSQISIQQLQLLKGVEKHGSQIFLRNVRTNSQVRPPYVSKEDSISGEQADIVAMGIFEQEA